MQKLIKIKEDHYVVVDDSKIEVDDWYIEDAKQIRKFVVSDEVYWQYRPYNREYKKITHSTQPMPHGVVREGQITGVTAISLQEVKELISEVDVMTKVVRDIEGTSWDEDAKPSFLSGYLRGYRQALEDNKEKKYTYYDIENAFNSGRGYGVPDNIKDFSSFIQSLQPPTEWEVEIVDGKLKLK